MNTCAFGESDPGHHDPESVPLVFYCGDETDDLRFHWPTPGGAALRVDVCERHAEELQCLLSEAPRG